MAASANRSASPSWAEEWRANLRRSSPKLAFDSQNQVSAVLALECLWPMHLRLQVPSLHHGLLTEHCENSWASWAAVASWSVTAKLEELLRSHQSSLLGGCFQPRTLLKKGVQLPARLRRCCGRMECLSASYLYWAECHCQGYCTPQRSEALPALLHSRFEAVGLQKGRPSDSVGFRRISVGRSTN